MFNVHDLIYLKIKGVHLGLWASFRITLIQKTAYYYLSINYYREDNETTVCMHYHTTQLFYEVTAEKD